MNWNNGREDKKGNERSLIYANVKVCFEIINKKSVDAEKSHTSSIEKEKCVIRLAMRVNFTQVICSPSRPISYHGTQLSDCEQIKHKNKSSAKHS